MGRHRDCRCGGVLSQVTTITVCCPVVTRCPYTTNTTLTTCVCVCVHGRGLFKLPDSYKYTGTPLDKLVADVTVRITGAAAAVCTIPRCSPHACPLHSLLRPTLVTLKVHSTPSLQPPSLPPTPPLLTMCLPFHASGMPLFQKYLATVTSKGVFQSFEAGSERTLVH